MSVTRIHNFAISLDGFATGEPQSADAPFGHAGQRLHEWMMATRFWDPQGTTGVDDAFAQRHSDGIGAEIMGAHKFGPPGWQDDPDWRVSRSHEGEAILSPPSRASTSTAGEERVLRRWCAQLRHHVQ